MSFLRRKQQPERGTTFMEEAIGSALDESQGRFAKSAPTFPGGTRYPRQPETSPWSQGNVTGVEPPFPVNISYVPPVGEAFEVQARAEELASPLSDVSEGGAPPRSNDPVPSAVDLEPGGTIPGAEIDDGCPGPRKPDGTPMSSPPLGLKRRA
jgi:hypothetical protein